MEKPGENKSEIPSIIFLKFQRFQLFDSHFSKKMYFLYFSELTQIKVKISKNRFFRVLTDSDAPTEYRSWLLPDPRAGFCNIGSKSGSGIRDFNIFRALVFHDFLMPNFPQNFFSHGVDVLLLLLAAIIIPKLGLVIELRITVVPPVVLQ